MNENGCRNLWIAVMNAAIKDASYAGRGKDLSRIRDQAIYWIYRSRNEVGSFVWVCRALNLDPAQVRKGLALSCFGAGPQAGAVDLREGRRRTRVPIPGLQAGATGSGLRVAGVSERSRMA